MLLLVVSLRRPLPRNRPLIRQLKLRAPCGTTAGTLEAEAAAAAVSKGNGVGVGVGVVDRFSGWYAPVALGAALVLAVVPEAEYALRHGQSVGCGVWDVCQVSNRRPS